MLQCSTSLGSIALAPTNSTTVKPMRGKGRCLSSIGGILAYVAHVAWCHSNCLCRRQCELGSCLHVAHFS